MAGVLQASQFQSSTANTAANANVRFFFETDTGILRYDFDGSDNSASPIIIATLQSGATMTASDIVIVSNIAEQSKLAEGTRLPSNLLWRSCCHIASRARKI